MKIMTTEAKSRVRTRSDVIEKEIVTQRPKGSRTRSLIGNVKLNDPSSVYVYNPDDDNKIGIYIKSISPEYAERLLATNHINQRKLKSHVVDSYVRAMKSGLWTSGNGESIKFSDSGELLDGQHRLSAIIKSGKTVNMLVMTGIKEKNINCIDNGATRNLGDVLRVTGNVKYKINTNSLAAFIRHFHYQKMISSEESSESSVRHRHKLCSIEAIKLYESMRNLDSILTQFTNLFSNKIIKRIPQSVGMLMFYLFYPINKEVTFKILKTLENGVPFDEKGIESPAWAICVWITERKMSGVRFTTNDYINAFVWAFDAMINGKSNIAYRANVDYYLGKNHAGCDQVVEVFERTKY
jgi:hypothetical protein